MLCRSLGAGHAISEMVTSKRELWDSLKTSRRADHEGEPAPIAVQIAGVDPQEMADAARHNVDRGAQIIDINMGCPAKKVCLSLIHISLPKDDPPLHDLLTRLMDALEATRPTPQFLSTFVGEDTLVIENVSHSEFMDVAMSHADTEPAPLDGAVRRP